MPRLFCPSRRELVCTLDSLQTPEGRCAIQFLFVFKASKEHESTALDAIAVDMKTKSWSIQKNTDGQSVLQNIDGQARFVINICPNNQRALAAAMGFQPLLDSALITLSQTGQIIFSPEVTAALCAGYQLEFDSYGRVESMQWVDEHGRKIDCPECPLPANPVLPSATVQGMRIGQQSTDVRNMSMLHYARDGNSGTISMCPHRLTTAQGEDITYAITVRKKQVPCPSWLQVVTVDTDMWQLASPDRVYCDRSEGQEKLCIYIGASKADKVIDMLGFSTLHASKLLTIVRPKAWSAQLCLEPEITRGLKNGCSLLFGPNMPTSRMRWQISCHINRDYLAFDAPLHALDELLKYAQVAKSTPCAPSAGTHIKVRAQHCCRLRNAQWQTIVDSCANAEKAETAGIWEIN